MNSKESKEWERGETPMDRKLDDVLARAMEVNVPEGLIDRTMERLPEAGSAPFGWWRGPLMWRSLRQRYWGWRTGSGKHWFR